MQPKQIEPKSLQINDFEGFYLSCDPGGTKLEPLFKRFEAAK
jgi:hypothetical protein